MKHTANDVLDSTQLDKAIAQAKIWWDPRYDFGCACMGGGPPPFRCGCQKHSFLTANALIAGLTIISILKFKESI